MAAGKTLRLKTAHGYYRPHVRPDGSQTDLQLSGLTVDEIETTIVQDLETHLASGGTLPTLGPGFSGAASRTVGVGGKTIQYRAIELLGGTIDVATYFEV